MNSAVFGRRRTGEARQELHGQQAARSGQGAGLRPRHQRRLQPQGRAQAAARDAAGDQRQGNQARRRPAAFQPPLCRARGRACQTLHIHLEEYAPGGTTQKHGHVNEAAFYILDGAGYEIHDGMRYDWKAGDVAIVHNNCVHQHFNASEREPARALVIKTKPMYLFMNMLFQHTVINGRRRRRRRKAISCRATTRRISTIRPTRSRKRSEMAWDEANAWLAGAANKKLYQDLLDDATARPARIASARRSCIPTRCRGKCRGRVCSSICSTSR